MNKRILITGASGFAGIHLIRELLKNSENEIFAAVFGKNGNLSGLLDEGHIKAGDLSDSEFAIQLVKEVRPDVIYHLAALTVVQDSVAKASRILSANIVLQFNMLEAMRIHAPRARFIAVCSAHEYGLVDQSDIPIDEDTPLKPLNPYAVSKVAQDMLAYQYFLAYGLDVVRLRPFNHTGSGQTTDFVIPVFASQFANISAGKQVPKIEVGNLDSIRDFTDVRDMVRAYILAADKCVSGEVYNIGFGKGIAIREVITLFEEISGVKVEIITHPEKVRHADVPVLLSDSTKFRGVTGWAPEFTFKETLSEVYNYYKEKLNDRLN